MKAFLCFCVIVALSLPALGDTYTGTVSDVKHFRNGGVAVDLDGHYPEQKMTYYIPPDAAAKVGALPAEGAKVTATGSIVQYKGKPEIKIYDAKQWQF
jgi:hypothetical protein